MGQALETLAQQSRVVSAIMFRGPESASVNTTTNGGYGMPVGDEELQLQLEFEFEEQRPFPSSSEDDDVVMELEELGRRDTGELEDHHNLDDRFLQ